MSSQDNTSSNSEFSKFFYDYVWAWALALTTLQNITYSSDGQQLSSKLVATQFEGASGAFNFKTPNDDHYPIRATLMQFCNRKLGNRKLGNRKLDNRKLGIRQFSRGSENSCHLIPPATVALSLWLEGYIILQTLVLIVLQAITIKYRKEPTVKAADRIFLHISYIGAYIFHIVAVLGIPLLRLYYRVLSGECGYCQWAWHS